ncbi:MAG: hypothetical protein DBX59_04550 [Bacillota bacterium]|nr:MAG: hypothetical protein DBX59_04550 [Bacillota bacterium]
MATNRIRFIEKLIFECIDKFDDYKFAYEQMRAYLKTKDVLDKTNYCAIAEMVFIDMPASTTILKVSDESKSCEASIYQYRKYIIKAFYYFLAGRKNLPFSADIEFDDIYKYFSTISF